VHQQLAATVSTLGLAARLLMAGAAAVADYPIDAGVQDSSG